MTIEEKPYSSVTLKQENNKVIDINEIEKDILNILAKTNYTFVSLYDSYSSRCNNTPLKDIVLNLEQHLKNKFVENEQDCFIAKQVFETIKAQFKILENLQENTTNKTTVQEVSVVLFATLFSYFKKYFI
jgi:hypothetical protein